jgi:hypothetical protein
METKEEAEVYLPSLINLKKLAAKHKRTAWLLDYIFMVSR